MELEFRVKGVVRVRETGQPLAGLIVRAYDKDLLYDDLLGDTKTDASGRFAIRYAGSDFQELSDRHPDIYFKILDASGERVIHSTAESIRWNAGTVEYFEIEIPQHKIAPSKERDIELVDAHGNKQTDFEVGDSLLLAMQGLSPGKSHLIRLMDDTGKEVFNISLIADRYEVIEPTVLWPDIGIGEADTTARFAYQTHEEAIAGIGGRTFSIEVLKGKKVVRKSKFQIGKKNTRPRLYPSSENGKLKRGLLLGRDELRVQGRNFPKGSQIDIYVVKRQYDWKAGDAISPIRNPDGSEVIHTIQLKREETDFNILLWPGKQLQTGSYTMIARVVLPHEFRANERVVRATDIISDRLMTSLVVRDDIYHYKPILQSCVMAMKEIVGKKLDGSPYFEFTNNFPKGTDVWAALDPAGLMPGAIGKKVRFYTVVHKTPSQWATDSNLTDVTGTIKEIVTSSGCINGNKTCVWTNPQQAGQYDLVVDFGNNDPNPASFIADGSFDPPTDMIDGYLNVGFYITDDPSMPGDFAVGQNSFNEPAVTIPAVGVWADPWGMPIYGNTPSGTLSLPLIAEVRYPADSNGVGVPVSTVQANYPVIVIMHGMHTTADPSYQGYNYLLDHLASHGFIAISIDCNAINAIGGMQDTRGHAILEHLSLLQSKNTNPGLFNGKIDMTKIGIMGHSRGGDGAVQAEIFNQSLGLGWNIKVVVALAPTDFSGTSPAPLNLTTSKFLCIYGSNDGDVWGGVNPSTQYAGTGFRFYDRATVEKAVVFIYGATHNRFNTEWGTEAKVDSSSPKVLSENQHHLLLCGYMTAFMQAHLQGRTEQLDYFNGELKISQVSSVDVHTQYQPPAPRLTLDDYESITALNQSSLGGTVTYANLDGSPQEDIMGTIDPYSPHQTRGIRMKWNAATAKYQSEIPLGSQRDISSYKFMSFRITQKAGSAANPADQLQDLCVRLNTAGGGNSRAVRAGYFGTIPYPYKPEYIASYSTNEGPNTKSALKTIRIPLYAWTIKAMSAPVVDLSNVESIAFEFTSKPTGEIEIDDIEFTT